MLLQASESPGGLLADSGDPNFPFVEKPEMKDWNYTAPAFEDFQKDFTDFAFKTNTTKGGTLLQKLDNTVRIPKLKADVCTNWLGATQNDGECHH